MYLGLDLGTSGVTALLLGGDLQVVGRSARAVQTLYPRPGWVEQHPHDVLAAVRTALQEVLEHLPRGAPLTAGFANPGESVLAWDARSGEALTPLQVWSDTRSAAVCDRLRAEGLEASLTKLSGLRLDPYFCAAKFAWLLEHSEAVQEALHGGFLRLCTLDAWLMYRLNGEYVTYHSTASRSSTIRSVAAGRPACWRPLVCQQASYPTSVRACQRSARSSSGHTAFPGRRPCSIRSRRWPEAAASALAESAGEARVRFLPAFSGLGAPWWQTGARGVLSGLSGQTGRAEIVRGVLDGIALCVSDILDQMRETLPQIQRVRADGGLAQNRYLLQRQADLSGVMIEQSREHEAAALGVALLAGVAAGALTWAQVQQRTADVTVFSPRLPKEERQRERELWQRWLAQAASL